MERGFSAEISNDNSKRQKSSNNSTLKEQKIW